MKTPKNIDVLFVAGFGPIVRDPLASRRFYSEALGLPLKEDTNGYLHAGGLFPPAFPAASPASS
jgi:catechol 2,3-dioxygenase-like lactoylglutathione lyase family enzyme